MEAFFLTSAGELIFLGAASILMIALIQFLHERFALLGAIGLLAYLQYAKIYDVFAAAKADPWWAVFWIIAYVVIGAGSLWPAWFGFVSDELEDFEETHPTLENFKDLKARDHKEMLTAWVFLWPWKLAWFLIRHPARRIKRMIFNAMETQLDKMSKSMTDSAKKRQRARDARPSFD